MYKIKYSGKIKKDIKIRQKRKYNFSELEKVIEKLLIAEPLEDRNREHNLSGNYAGFRECHIAPDWLLIYRYDGDYLEIVRTGTHSDLFGK